MRLRILPRTRPGPRAPTRPRAKPPTRIPVCTLYQEDTSIQWVNILFDFEDHSMTDLQLLRRIERSFTERSMKQKMTLILTYPLMPLKPFCVSIPATGSFETDEDILIDAHVTVKQWMRDLPVRGLPFRRGDIFQRGSWKKLNGLTPLRW